MGKSTKNESYDEFYIKKNTSMNSLKIVFPYEYFSGLVKLNWYDVWLAIEHGFLNYKAAIDHAVKEIDVNSNKDVQELTLLLFEKNIFPYSIHPNIDQLADIVPIEKKIQAKEKLLYAVLNWLFEQKYKYSDLQDAVDIIYADFDYPKSMAYLWRYTQHLSKKYSTIQSPMERLNKELVEFLNKQKNNFN